MLSSLFYLKNIIYAEVYIFQNTMVVGGGEWLLEKKMKTEGVGKKMKKKGNEEKEKTGLKTHL